MALEKDKARHSPDLKSMEWITGNSLLPGLPFKFRVNEYGLIEVADGLPPAGKEPSSPADLSECLEDEADDILSCKSCKGYGFAKDFIEASFCSIKCKFKPLINSTTASEPSRIRNEDNGCKSLKSKSPSETPVIAPVKKQRLSVHSERDKNNKNTKVPFSWSKYLDKEKSQAAPEKLFPDSFTFIKHGFRTGMKLEAIDPEHQSLFCVVTIVDVQGNRLRLHFDGYSDSYDFWVNADSNNIFPAGWCEKNGQKLQLPRDYNSEKPFAWFHFLKQSGSICAPRHLFTTQSIAPVPNAFRVGLKLEAVDRRHSAHTVCVATVANTMGSRFLVHFDGWDSIYDYWADPTSPHVHPVGWCEQNGQSLLPPCNYKGEFSWSKYLSETRSAAVPTRAFKARPPLGFKAGMKLESVDPRNPQFVRVASVIAVKGYRLKIHFDGWSSDLDFWTDDDWPDLHPPGWCQKTGHALQPPPAPSDKGPCQIHGCLGLGHVQGAKYSSHSSLEHCPYASANIQPESSQIKDRLSETATTNSTQDAAERVENAAEVEGTSIEALKQQIAAALNNKKPRFWTKRHPVSPVPNPTVFSSPTRSGEAGTAASAGRALSYSVNSEDLNQAMLSLHPSQMNSNLLTPISWSRNVKLLDSVLSSLTRTQVSSWGHGEVAELVEKLGINSEDLEHFKEQEIDGESFLLLTQSDLTDLLKLKLGPAVKIFNAILYIRKRQ